MGARKQNNYSIEELQVAQISRALAHPVRKQMVANLIQYGPCRNIDFSNRMNMVPSTIKEHVQFLKDADLVRIHYESHYYDIVLNPSGFKLLVDFLEVFR